MIAWMRGMLREKHPPFLLVEVNGVGYELEAPLTTFFHLPESGREVTLFTHQLVREDAHLLYGFHGADERNMFRMLLRVNGVGAKLALAILSGMDAGELARCVHEDDTTRLARLPGIGKKTAARLVMEMRDRIVRTPGAQATGAAAFGGALPADAVGEAVSALIALGLKPHEASRRVQAFDCSGLPSEEIVRRALQALAR